MADLHIEYLPVGSLKPYPRNARTHSQKLSMLDQRAATPILEFLQWHGVLQLKECHASVTPTH